MHIKSEPGSQLAGANGTSRSSTALVAAGRNGRGSPGFCQSVPVVACTDFMVYDWALLRGALKYVVRTTEEAYVKRMVVRLPLPLALLLPHTMNPNLHLVSI